MIGGVGLLPTDLRNQARAHIASGGNPHLLEPLLEVAIHVDPRYLDVLLLYKKHIVRAGYDSYLTASQIDTLIEQARRRRAEDIDFPSIPTFYEALRSRDRTSILEEDLDRVKAVCSGEHPDCMQAARLLDALIPDAQEVPPGVQLEILLLQRWIIENDFKSVLVFTKSNVNLPHSLALIQEQINSIKTHHKAVVAQLKTALRSHKKIN